MTIIKTSKPLKPSSKPSLITNTLFSLYLIERVTNIYLLTESRIQNPNTVQTYLQPKSNKNHNKKVNINFTKLPY